MLFAVKKFFLLLFVSSALVQAENWAQFRGPGGRGISGDKGIPVKWTAKDYRWKVKLAGVGHSSPVVWDNTVLITSAARAGERRALTNN